MQQRFIVGYCVSAGAGRSGEKSAIRGNRKNREAPDEGAFILKKKGRRKKMEIVEIDINEIKPYEKNPRLNDSAIEKVAESIKNYGFKQPIVVDRNMVIIVGHTRYKAAKKLDLKKVPCIIANDLTEKQAKAYRIADNKVADYSIFDNKLLLEELNDLNDEFTGFNIGELTEMSIDDINQSDILEGNEYGVEYVVQIKVKTIDEAKEIAERYCL